MKKRIRNEKLNIWLSEKEKEILEDKCKEVGLTRSEYVRRMITGRDINNKYLSVDKEIAQKWLEELNIQGNCLQQLNQIVKSEHTNLVDINWTLLLENYGEAISLLSQMPYMKEE